MLKMSTTQTTQIHTTMTTSKIEAYTMLGMSEYFGKSHLYDGAGYDRCSGTKEEVIAYLEKLIPEVGDEALTWRGQNGTWFSGEDARQMIAGEIEELKNGTHISLQNEEEAE